MCKKKKSTTVILEQCSLLEAIRASINFNRSMGKEPGAVSMNESTIVLLRYEARSFSTELLCKGKEKTVFGLNVFEDGTLEDREIRILLNSRIMRD